MVIYSRLLSARVESRQRRHLLSRFALDHAGSLDPFFARSLLIGPAPTRPGREYCLFLSERIELAMISAFYIDVLAGWWWIVLGLLRQLSLV